MVRAMSGYGMPAADICRVVAKGISEHEFVSACSDDLEQGQIQASAKLQEQLYTQAVNGNTAALLHLSRQATGGQLQAIVSTAEMCSWLGITKAALGDLKKRGVVEMVSRDRWNVKSTVRAISQHYREISAGRKAASQEADAPDLVTERALLARAQRESVEMDNDVTRGSLMRREAVVDLFGRLNHAVVRELATLPDRVERDLRVDVTVSEYVRQTVRDLREDIASAIDELRAQH